LLTPGGYAANEFPPPSRHDLLKTSNPVENLDAVTFTQAHDALRKYQAASEESLSSQVIERRDFSGLAA